jgi:hypothetical protein
MSVVGEALKQLSLWWIDIRRDNWYCQLGEYIKSIRKPPDPAKSIPKEVKASAKRTLLILGLMAAMDNIDIKHDKVPRQQLRKAGGQCRSVSTI